MNRMSAVLDYTWPVLGGVAMWIHAAPIIGPLGERLVAALRGPEPVSGDPLDMTQPDTFRPPHVAAPSVSVATPAF